MFSITKGQVFRKKACRWNARHGKVVSDFGVWGCDRDGLGGSGLGLGPNEEPVIGF